MVSYQEKKEKRSAQVMKVPAILTLLSSVGLRYMNSHCLAWSVCSECFKVLQGRAEIIKDAEFIFHTSSEA